MKKTVILLFEILGFALKLILIFGLIIVGIDLFNRSEEDKRSSQYFCKKQ